ncbi:MAG TPA: hypothetical protein VFB43_17835 [Terracidiphilus sp.]|nr:hypothetical protein [Terracidiphilus sp.]
MAEVDADSKPLIGRYDRTKRYRPGLTDCVSRVTASLPRRALAEAVVAMDVTSRQLIVVRV